MLVEEDTKAPDASQTLRIWGICESITRITGRAQLITLGTTSSGHVLRCSEDTGQPWIAAAFLYHFQDVLSNRWIRDLGRFCREWPPGLRFCSGTVEGGASGQRLTILAIEQRAHRLSPSLVCFTHCLALIRVHGAPSRRGAWFRSAARRAAVGETGLVRFQFELLRADRADFEGESHLSFMIRRA